MSQYASSRCNGHNTAYKLLAALQHNQINYPKLQPSQPQTRVVLQLVEDWNKLLCGWTRMTPPHCPLSNWDAHLEQGVMSWFYSFHMTSIHLTHLSLLSLTHLSLESSWIHDKPLTMSHSFIYASYPLLTDTLYLSTVERLTPLARWHSTIPSPLLCIPIGRYK